MGTPSIGSVVLVPFPFSDLSNSKKRPAVVVASAGRGGLDSVPDHKQSLLGSQPYTAGFKGLHSRGTSNTELRKTSQAVYSKRVSHHFRGGSAHGGFPSINSESDNYTVFGIDKYADSSR